MLLESRIALVSFIVEPHCHQNKVLSRILDVELAYTRQKILIVPAPGFRTELHHSSVKMQNAAVQKKGLDYPPLKASHPPTLFSIEILHNTTKANTVSNSNK